MAGTDLIKCVECNHVDVLLFTGAPIKGLYYCSQCHPSIKKWHGKFPRERYDETTHAIINGDSDLTFS